MEAAMTNEEIIAMCDKGEALEYDYGATVTHIGNIPELLDLARQDERGKVTEEKVKEYLGGLGGKEAALIVLNYLLRGGITNDDLRGLRLQWIKDEREKMQGVEVYISWDEGSFESPTVTTKQPQTNKDSAGRIYHTDLGQNFTIKKEDAEKLGISQGQCKKVRIVEVLP